MVEPWTPFLIQVLQNSAAISKWKLVSEKISVGNHKGAHRIFKIAVPITIAPLALPYSEFCKDENAALVAFFPTLQCQKNTPKSVKDYVKCARFYIYQWT